MRALIIVLSLTSSCYAGETNYFQNTFRTSGDVASVNAAVMERLRQEAGSERGLYHVYLPDGRLQRVEYTAAPVTQQKPADYKSFSFPNTAQTSAPSIGNVYYVEVPSERLQALQSSGLTFQRQSNYQYEKPSAYRSNAAPSDASSPFGNAYYVEVPSDRLQALQQQAFQETSQQQNYDQETPKTAAYAQPFVVDAQFAPLEVITVDQLAQLRSHQ